MEFISHNTPRSDLGEKLRCATHTGIIFAFVLSLIEADNTYVLRTTAIYFLPIKSFK